MSNSPVRPRFPRPGTAGTILARRTCDVPTSQGGLHLALSRWTCVATYLFLSRRWVAANLLSNLVQPPGGLSSWPSSTTFPPSPEFLREAYIPSANPEFSPIGGQQFFPDEPKRLSTFLILPAIPALAPHQSQHHFPQTLPIEAPDMKADSPTIPVPMPTSDIVASPYSASDVTLSNFDSPLPSTLPSSPGPSGNFEPTRDSGFSDSETLLSLKTLPISPTPSRSADSTSDADPQTPPPKLEAPSRKARKLKGNVTRQENALCRSCGNEKVVHLLHGPESLLSSDRRIMFTCNSCYTAACLDATSLREPATVRSFNLGEKASKIPSPPAGKRKKGLDESHSEVFCSACDRWVGVGQILVRAGEPLPDDLRPREEWVEPMFEAEVVLEAILVFTVLAGQVEGRCGGVQTKGNGRPNSRILFNFNLNPQCHFQCGGGGVFRTGKWRPRELFVPERRNCSLSHERTGAVTYDYEPLRCLDEVTPAYLTAMRSVFAELQLSFRACAKEMEASVEHRTYGRIVARLEVSLSELSDFIGTQPPIGVERFIVVQWEAGKVKAKGRNSDVKPRTGPEPSTSTISPLPRRLHGVLSVQVNHIKGIIFISYTFTKNSSRFVYSGYFRGAINAAVASHEANYPTFPPLAHVCVPLWKRDPEAPAKMQHSHSSNWGGFTFRPVEKYAAERHVDKNLFDEPGVLSEVALLSCENWGFRLGLLILDVAGVEVGLQKLSLGVFLYNSFGLGLSGRTVGCCRGCATEKKHLRGKSGEKLDLIPSSDVARNGPLTFFVRSTLSRWRVKLWPSKTTSLRITICP
ncbi:hypothetical protein BDK51DRAFT_34713 [Blyttiomyces helicus]|uniref:Uncharacterized protein n=1 Tax=Blyttiomyces helicus TaxID=388810 RepID=A0A4P9WNE4_9FUNG|nr:hypothetical protein BDK51DRAFT_34713 [Blyttiomyces helicus]|eukprot:RKO93795.1 hypothetical protein BDK51DRAFT_34713 [Blyttiomyces helicus]